METTGTLTSARSARNLWFLCAILIAWNVFAAYRLTLPLKSSHEGWVARQIGRTGRNHVVLGLNVTKGTTVVDVRHNGNLDIHRSYSPLASWTVALPMAAGLGFNLSIRLPLVLSSNLFLIGLWSLADQRWGRRTADLALLYGAFCPIFVFRYGLTCIFEILALGPLMISAALFAAPRRDPLRWSLIAISALAAVMYSWICWLVIVPCLVRDWRDGYRRVVLALGSLVLGFPVVLHFLLMSWASGDLLFDIHNFFFHIGERSSAQTLPGAVEVTYQLVLGLLYKRWLRGIGIVPLVCTLACLVLALVGSWKQKRFAGAGWVVTLFVMALPLNLARNIAYFHDFFVILFVPVAAVSSALVTSWLISRSRAWASIAAAALVVTFLAWDALPRYRYIATARSDIEHDAIVEAIGAAVDEADFVVVNLEVSAIDPRVVPILTDAQRETSPRPYYCGQMSQTVFLATDTADVERLSRRARADQRVVLIEVGGTTFALPPSFKPVPTGVPRLLVGVRPPVLAANADAPRRTR